MIYAGACYLHSHPVTQEYTLLSCSSEELKSKEVLKPAQGQSQSPRTGFHDSGVRILHLSPERDVVSLDINFTALRDT